jgi:cell division protein FtsB
MSALPPLPGKYKAVAVFGISALVVVLVSAVYGGRGWMHLQELAVKQQSLEDLVFRLQQENERRQEHLRRLATDDGYVEKLAREQLGWIKPGETVYRVRGVTAAEPQISVPPPPVAAPPRKSASSSARASRAKP